MHSVIGTDVFESRGIPSLKVSDEQKVDSPSVAPGSFKRFTCPNTHVSWLPFLSPLTHRFTAPSAFLSLRATKAKATAQVPQTYIASQGDEKGLPELDEGQDQAAYVALHKPQHGMATGCSHPVVLPLHGFSGQPNAPRGDC